MRREQFRIVDAVRELERDNLLPAIVFRTSRIQCDEDVEHVGRVPYLQLPVVAQRELQLLIRQLVSQYDMDFQLITTHPQYRILLTTGIGAHHAGQLLMWRLLLEELMASGVLRVLIATGTVAAGVDFPARTVMITAHSRRGANGFEAFRASEFQQMSGRAGRRGRDTVGFCVVAPAPFCDARTLLKISKRSAEPLVSAYYPSSSTVLNLLRYRNVDDLRFTVERSLASFTDRRESRQFVEEAERLEKEFPFLANNGGSSQKNAEDSDEEDSQNIIGKQTNTAVFSREEKRVKKKIRRLRREAQELQNRQNLLLESVLSGLSKLGYLEGMNLSEKGYWAANLCTSLVLEIAELIESKILSGVSAERLAAIMSCLCADMHRSYLELKMSALSPEDEENISLILERVKAIDMPGSNEARQVLPTAANTVVTWMHTDTWQHFRSLLALSNVAEGDAARLITQTAEQLNQISRLTDSHPELALRSEEAKRRLLRPPLTEAINLETM